MKLRIYKRIKKRLNTFEIQKQNKDEKRMQRIKKRLNTFEKQKQNKDEKRMQPRKSIKKG